MVALYVALALAGVAMMAMTSQALSADRAVSKGPIPQSAITSTGEIDPTRVPDFVPVWSRDGSHYAGYVARAYVLGLEEPRRTAIRDAVDAWPVYGPDLTTLVGRMFPDKGFVPLGTDPQAFPDATVVAGPAQ
jgi:hypothetical protein